MSPNPTGTPTSKKPKPLFILPKSHFDKVASSDLLSKRPPTPYYPPSNPSGLLAEPSRGFQAKEDQHKDDQKEADGDGEKQKQKLQK